MGSGDRAGQGKNHGEQKKEAGKAEEGWVEVGVRACLEEERRSAPGEVAISDEGRLDLAGPRWGEHGEHRAK